MPNVSKVAIIGGGIAGLCAGVYARKCGYDVDVFEMNETSGGLATSWSRSGYTFEGCMHWLAGSNPQSSLYARWQEVFDIGKLKFIDHAEYVRIEPPAGQSLTIFTDVDRMEAELLARAPEDAEEIRHFASAIRDLTHFEIPDLSDSFPHLLWSLIRAVPEWPAIHHWSGISVGDFGRRFHNPLLRAFFSDSDIEQLSCLALVFSLAWMNGRNAGYPIGGSQAVIRLVVENLERLGGRLRLGTKVEKILVEHDSAVGVELAGGEQVAADWVLSAADGHWTIYELLGGRYRTTETDEAYEKLTPFSSFLQVSLGINRELSSHGPLLCRLLDRPLKLDPATELSRIMYRFFYFDPTFAAPGKTAVTCFLPTRNFGYWLSLQANDPSAYQAEKRRVADEVIGILVAGDTGLQADIEVVDVSTPASVIRHTGNWKGSSEGWLPTPQTGFRPLPRTLHGLRHFVMAGQWVMPGGGLPSGLLTGRSAIREICREDHVEFAP